MPSIEGNESIYYRPYGPLRFESVNCLQAAFGAMDIKDVTVG